MPRNSSPGTIIGIAWDLHPDPETDTYEVYWKPAVEDSASWLSSIDAGELQPSVVIAVPNNSYNFPGGHPDNQDYAVVAHATNFENGIERWSTPYFPEVFRNVPLEVAVPELAQVTGGRLLSDG